MSGGTRRSAIHLLSGERAIVAIGANYFGVKYDR